MATEEKLAQLREKARAVRRHIITMVGAAGSGHPGGSLSAADMVTALYFSIMRVDPQRPHWPDRDRFVLSKGHAAPVLYAALAERGFFPPEKLPSLRRLGSPLQGHPDMRKVPGAEMSTGSLGQGLSAANGMALAGKLDGRDYRVYVMLGDGESQEGQIWEAAMAAAHYKLDNVIAFLDYNGLQIDGPVTQIMSLEPVADKWRSFGWAVQEIDGHDMGAILDAVNRAREVRDKPSMIVARTVKGRGCSFMENQVGWHGSAPNPGQVEQALKEMDDAPGCALP